MLDFGIARFLKPDSSTAAPTLTAAEERVMTRTPARNRFAER
jgi:hypothetical protein